MNKAELREQIEEMTEEEAAAEVKLIYAPAWPDKAIPIEEIRRDDDAAGSDLVREGAAAAPDPRSR